MARTTRSSLAPLAAATLLALAACGQETSPAASGGEAVEDPAGPTVLTSFYPLQFVTERVGGDRVSVENLTAPGAEPHDLELSARDVGRVQDADLVVYLSGFQPTVDEAAADAQAALDVADAAALVEHEGVEDDHDHGDDDHDHSDDDHDHDHSDDEHADDDHTDDATSTGTATSTATATDDATSTATADDHGHDHGPNDPHFWLDPLRLADVGDAVADRLAQVDPDGAQEYAAGAADLRADLEALDEDFTTGLQSCTSTEMVTAHEAFGYLADRYGMTQLGIAGITPDTEPSAAELAAVTDFVREHSVTTIYTETLVSPAVAETVAAETGATTAVLDPLEGLSSDDAGPGGQDYLSVMQTNLQTLRTGQGCS